METSPFKEEETEAWKDGVCKSSGQIGTEMSLEPRSLV